MGIEPTTLVEFNIDRESDFRDKNPIEKDESSWTRKKSTTILALKLFSENGISVTPQIEIINSNKKVLGIRPPIVNGSWDELEAFVSFEDLGILGEDKLSIRVVEKIKKNTGDTYTSAQCLSVHR